MCQFQLPVLKVFIIAKERWFLEQAIKCMIMKTNIYLFIYHPAFLCETRATGALKATSGRFRRPSDSEIFMSCESGPKESVFVWDKKWSRNEMAISNVWHSQEDKVNNMNKEKRVWTLSWEDSPGGGYGNPLQYSCPENPMGSLEGYSPQGQKELGPAEATSHACMPSVLILTHWCLLGVSVASWIRATPVDISLSSAIDRLVVFDPIS